MDDHCTTEVAGRMFEQANTVAWSGQLIACMVVDMRLQDIQSLHQLSGLETTRLTMKAEAVGVHERCGRLPRRMHICRVSYVEERS